MDRVNFLADRPWDLIENFTNKRKRRNDGTLKDGTGTLILYNEDDTIKEVLFFKNGLEQTRK